MAEHGSATTGTQPHPDMDYPQHDRTYQGFVFAAKWGTIVVVGILSMMALFLVR